MTRKQHLCLRALAITVIVVLQLLPRGEKAAGPATAANAPPAAVAAAPELALAQAR